MAIDLVDDTLVKFIIDLGGDVNLADRQGRTPLGITWENLNKFNRLEVEQRTLLNDEETWVGSRKRIEKKLEEINEDRNANIRIVRFLVEAGANIHEKTLPMAGNAILVGGGYFSAFLTPVSVETTDDWGRTLLHLAAEMEKYQLIQSIADTNERRSVDKRNNEGKTALDLALNRPESVAAMRTAEQLILVGAFSENPLFEYLAPAVQNSDYNMLGFNGDAPMHFAASGNYDGLVQYLLEKRADVNIRNSRGATPFQEAVKKGHITMMRRLISGGADINVQDAMGNTAMHLAPPVDWHREVLNFLIDNGANPNIKNEDGNTSLHAMIILDRDADIILRLLSGGADVSIRNSEGKTPLYLAVQENRLTYIAPLLSYNSDVFAEDNQEISPIERALLDRSPTLDNLITPITVSLHDHRGDTLLHKAVLYHGTAAVVSFMLEKGAWIDARNKAGDTSLHLAMRQNEKESGKMLLSSPYKPDLFITNAAGETPIYLMFHAPGGLREWALTPASVTIQDGLGNTMLHYAAQWRQDDHIPAIIKIGADIEAKNNAGETPIFDAVKNRMITTIQILILARASVSVRNNLGNTPLHTAIRWNTLDGAEVLIKAGADINALNTVNGKTPLHDAVRMGMSEFADLLIKNNANLEIRDSEGNTPLIEAFRAGLTGMAERLATAGADLRVRDIQGNTPLHIAIAMDRLDLVTLILRQDPDIHAKNVEGKSPFQIALTKTNAPHIVWALLTGSSAAGRRIELNDDNGSSPLHIAVQQNVPLSMLGLILEQGGKINALDAQGRTPLRLAVDMEAWNTTRFLINNGADIFSLAKDGQNPASVVLDKGLPALRGFFNGTAVNTWDVNGDTILHYAVRHRSANGETIRLLLDLGADKNIRNHNGKNPLQMAREINRSADIIRYLDR
jgi:ankyrin repeat protein